MLSLEELPNDILLEIAEILLPHKRNLCQLRLVSRRLNIIVSPVLFRRLVISIRNYKTEGVIPLDESQGWCIISAIASGSTTVYEHTKDLIVDTKTSTVLRNESSAGLEFKDKLVDMIFDVISMFKNLRSFGYLSNPQEHPENLHNKVILALGTLPRLEIISHLRFYNNPPALFTLEPISNLTKFAGSWVPRAPHFIREIASLLPRCPNLIQLRLISVFHKDVTLNDIFRETGEMENALKLRELHLDGLVVSADAFRLYARHFKSLTSITVIKSRSPSASTDLGEICRSLQQSGIYLEHVSSDHPEDLLLLSYLTSYSVLKRLEFTLVSLGERENDSKAVNILYTQVLPSHSDVLEELRLHIYQSEVWGNTPTEDQLAGLSKCRKLRTLVAPSTFTCRCELNARTIWELWFKVGSQLSELEYMSILLKETHSSRVDNAIMKSWYASREELMVEYQKKKGVKFTVE